MADAWSAWVEVLPDFTEFKKTADTHMTAVLGTAGTAGGKKAGTGVSAGIVGGITGALAFGALSVAGDVGRLIGNTIGNSINFALDGIDLASDLAETQTAVQQIFGPATAAINEFVSTANTALGQTQQQALDATKTFGALGQAAGLTGDDLSGFSTELVTLATDLASFNNTDVDTALNALRSGLSGESEPLRQFQVFLNDAKLKQAALTLGIYDGSGALTDQQRILAAHQVILESTTNQQGDFAKTSAGLAGQQKILASAFEDVQTKLGTALLPVMTELTTLAVNDLIPVLSDLIDQIGPELAASLSESLPAFKELVLAVAPLIPQLVQLGVEALPPLLDLFILLAPVLIDNAASSATMTAAFAGFLDLISGDTTLLELGVKLDEMGGSFSDFTKWVARAGSEVGRFLTQLAVNVMQIPNTVRNAIGDLGGLLFNSGKSIIQGFINGINAMIAPVRNAVNSVMRLVAGFFPNSPAQFGPFSGAGWAALENSGKAIADQFSAGLDGNSSTVRDSMQNMITPPHVSTLTPVASAGSRVMELGADTMRALLDALHVELLTDDTLLASSAGRGSGFQTALGAA